MSEPPLHTPETGTRASSFEPLTPPASSNHRMIVEQREFDDYCAELESAEAIAFDTEFVSEDGYRPDLCLIQVATRDGLVVIDPKPLDSVDRFWQVIIEGDHETIVHSGREELRFCLHATEALPKKLIDVQLAAGLTGLEYPAAYRTLVHKLVHVELSKAETRTNWRARPLTEGQIGYALTDVDHLIPLRNELFKRLARLDRVQCCYEETEIWARGVQRAEMVDPWRRVGGSGGLNPKGLAIVKAVWEWREETASRRNCPARRVLRDDLVVELAKRSSHNLSKIKNIRGFDRGDLKRHLDEISSRIESVLNSSPSTWPRPRNQRPSGPSLGLLVQFLQTALGCICREKKIATSIVGTSQDLRDFVAFRLGLSDQIAEQDVALLQGWRQKLVADLLDQLLRGEISIGVDNPKADQPLRLFGPIEDE